VTDKQAKDNFFSAEHFLDIACKNLPVVHRAISEHGDVPLSKYLKNFFTEPVSSYQKRDDFFEAVYKYAAPLLGNSVAMRAASDLALNPVVLTANHHGAYYFSQSIQASLIFSLNILSGETAATTVPVFSCGNVPLNNSEYPRGILIYQTTSSGFEDITIKLPVFPDRLKRRMVSVTPAYDKLMIHRAETRLQKMVHERRISPSLADSLQEIFQKDYCAPSVIALPNYSQQVVALNSRIWKRLFSETKDVPELICLEIEKIAATLLMSDLSNPKSLAGCVLFDPALRAQVLSRLDGVRGCWKLDKLVRRLHMNRMNETQRTAANRCGTVFFWGIDSLGRRIPLYLENNASNRDVLRGVDDRGNVWELPYTAREIKNKLKENRILPSIFTCYLVLLARGVICIGGYFQCVYLPEIQRSLCDALQKTGYHDVARLVTGIPTNFYLQGMLAIMRKTEHGYLPAGPIEIIAGGGITNKDIEQMLSLTVREAHLAALFETGPDGVPSELLPENWKKHLAIDCSRILKDKVVIVSNREEVLCTKR